MAGPRDPRFFDPQHRADNQSDLPSQQTPAGVPYYPAEMPEIFQQTPEGLQASAEAAMADAEANSAGGGNYSFTRHTYDSRPPLAYDFAGPINTGVESSIVLYNGATRIPDGFVGIIRGFSCTVRADFFTMDQFGGFDTSAQITLLRNGVPIPGMTNINVGQWGCGTVDMPCFIMLNGGDVISGQWNNGLVLYQYGGGFNFWGQLLQDDGRDTPQQAGNMRPAPVVETDAAAIGAGAVPPPGGGYAMPSPMPAAAPVFQSEFATFVAQGYPGPFPPSIGVGTYLQLRQAHHKKVRNQYLAFVAANPGKTIDVQGDSPLATVPYIGP